MQSLLKGVGHEARDSKMTFDYGSECNPHLLSCVQLRSGQVKLFNLLLKLDQWEKADAIPLNRPKQHVVCLHHFDRLMKFDRNLDGRTRRETTAKGDIAFMPADVPTILRPPTDDPHRLSSSTYLLFQPSY